MAIIEKYGPIAITVFLSVILIYFHSEIMCKASSGSLKFGSLYTAVFDWAAIQTGFLFAIYGYISGKNRGFIAKIQHTEEMSQFMRFQKRSMYLGFALTIFSIPMIITEFSITAESYWHYALFVAWSQLAIFAFFSFLRVAYLFGIIIHVKQKKEIRG